MKVRLATWLSILLFEPLALAMTDIPFVDGLVIQVPVGFFLSLLLVARSRR